jgi:osmotically-inducible protein OsmY
MSVWVDTRFLDVEVEDGKVTLSGTVGSETERQRAAALAWVAGVKDVSIDGVETNWWAEDRMRRKDRYPVPPDAEIANAVEAAMVYDPRVFSFNVDADVRNGVATLTGTVDNLKAKRAAGQNAKNTIGVWRVKNHLRVRPMAMPDDIKIATDIRNAFTRDPYVERYDVDVDVIGGRVYLSGDVHTSFERQQAEELATRINGVTDVVNNIDYNHAWTRLPDQEIKDDVETQLYWSPFVDSQDITVAVEDGVVTLTGTVEDWSEWRDAEENAFEGNAKDVRNKLKIAGT